MLQGPKAIVGDAEDLVQVGDVVLFRFERSARATDKKQSNYCLPLHIGEITRVLNTDKIEVWWMFADAWDRRWLPWRDPKTKRAYKEVMDASAVLQDTHGRAAKLQFIISRKKRLLTKASLDLIAEILAVDEYSTGIE
jgi:hypothetical protein